jgi:hypothetical protein
MDVYNHPSFMLSTPQGAEAATGSRHSGVGPRFLYRRRSTVRPAQRHAELCRMAATLERQE